MRRDSTLKARDLQPAALAARAAQSYRLGMRRSPPLRSRLVRRVAGALAFAAWLPARQAGADEGPRVSIHWGRLAAALRDAGPLFSPEAWFPHAWGNAGVTSPDRTPGVHMSPQLSVVARDWGAAQALIGPLALTDRLRLSRSSRMVISRLRISGGSVIPFAQAGLGQWRIDTDLLPVMPRDVELAGQVGGGVELRISQSSTVGFEADYTILYREQHEPQMLSGPHLWATYFAAKAKF